MDDIRAYLSRLRKRLTRISRWKQEDIFAEIESHIEDGLQDPEMGVTEKERRERIMSELGRSNEMADGMNSIHRQHNWLDVLLGPFVFIITWPLASLVLHATGDNYRLLSFFMLPLYFSMVFVARHRRSSLLEGWWLSWTFLSLLSSLWLALFLTRGLMRLSSVLWGVLLLLALSLLVRRIWQSRGDGLLVALSIQPITLSFATVTLLTIHRGILPKNISGYLENGLTLVIYGATLAFVLVMSRRPRRWASLMAGMLVYAAVAAAAIGWYRPGNIASFAASIAMLLTGLFLPIFVGLCVEYRYIRRNPLVVI